MNNKCRRGKMNNKCRLHLKMGNIYSYSWENMSLGKISQVIVDRAEGWDSCQYNKGKKPNINFEIQKSNDGTFQLSSKYFNIEPLISESGYILFILKYPEERSRDPEKREVVEGVLCEIMLEYYNEEVKQAIGNYKYENMTLADKSIMVDKKSPRYPANLLFLRNINIFIFLIISINMFIFIVSADDVSIHLVEILSAMLFIFLSFLFMILFRCGIFWGDKYDEIGSESWGLLDYKEYSIEEILSPVHFETIIKNNLKYLNNPDVDYFKNSSPLYNVAYLFSTLVSIIVGLGIWVWLGFELNIIVTLIATASLLVLAIFEYKYHASSYMIIFGTLFILMLVIFNNSLLLTILSTYILTIIYILIDNFIYILLYKKNITPENKEGIFDIDEFKKLYQLDITLQSKIKLILSVISSALIVAPSAYLTIADDNVRTFWETLGWMGGFLITLLFYTIVLSLIITLIGFAVYGVFLLARYLFRFIMSINNKIMDVKPPQVHASVLYILALIALIYIFIKLI